MSRHLCLCAIVAVSLCSALNAATITVDQNNMNGWAFNPRDGSNAPGGTGVGEFVGGPGTPPAGLGSARLFVGSDGTGAIRFEKSYAGTLLNDITALNYHTFVGYNAATVVAPFIQMVIDEDGNGTVDDALVYEPAYNGYAGTTNTWQNWDTFNVATDNWYGANVGDTTQFSLAAYKIAHPNAKLIDSGSGPGFRFIAGFGWPANFDGNVDAFTITLAGNTTTYDFEPIPEPASALSLAVLTGLLSARRSRRSVA